VRVAAERVKDPMTFKEAINSLHRNEWLEAMQKELDSLHELNTFRWVDVPLDLQKEEILSSKWVYKAKYNPDGTFDKFKVSLVARGFNQIKGVN
jgi:hypothetical protein